MNGQTVIILFLTFYSVVTTMLYLVECKESRNQRSQKNIWIRQFKKLKNR